MTQSDESPATPELPPVVIKKYANRRLYNTESSSYITLDNLADMVRRARDFVVYDARTGDDITRSVLTQIIVEEESKGKAMLPTAFLRQLIGFYGGALPSMMPRYIEQTMSGLARQQEQVRSAMQQTMGNLIPPGFEELGRQNMAMMDRAMSLFSPFYRNAAEKPAEAAPAAPAEEEAASEEMIRLRAEVQLLKTELEIAKLQGGPETADAPAIDDGVPRIYPGKRKPA